MTRAETDETTERIRSAALGLFAERGYGNTTMEHISNAAQVGVATMYRRWSDKPPSPTTSTPRASSR